MLQCPICQTEYLEGLVNCSNCGWDLTPYPFTFQLPQGFIQKEQAKLNWAKAMWKQSQNQATLTHSEVEELQNQILHLKSQLQQMEANITLATQEKHNLENQSQLSQDSLLQWLPDLNLQLAQELAQIPDKHEAIKKIDELIQSNYNNQINFYTNNGLKIIKSALFKNIYKHKHIGKYLTIRAVDVHPLIQINSILNARHELKLKGIIKRDIDGDTLYE
ncbi:hypothetical protein NIES2101_34070 [Calothrix sp. HK-06]|nr:hypothetical protein NIES2101_34070 [Calothrix sp. HK-06]